VQPFPLIRPLRSHWAAMEGGTPVSTTPPPSFQRLWGHVAASYRRVTGFPSFSPIRVHRWMSKSSSGSFGFGRLSITVDVTSYGRIFWPSTTCSSRLARPSRTRGAVVWGKGGGDGHRKSISLTPLPRVLGIVTRSEWVVV